MIFLFINLVLLRDIILLLSVTASGVILSSRDWVTCFEPLVLDFAHFALARHGLSASTDVRVHPRG